MKNILFILLLLMGSNSVHPYLDIFGKDPRIGNLRKEILAEGCQQNIPVLKTEIQVDSLVIRISSQAVTSIESREFNRYIASDLKSILELVTIAEIRKNNWHYMADSDHPNIGVIMLGLIQGNTREYNRLYREALLYLQDIYTGNKGYFDTDREIWKQESYPQKYSQYIHLIRDMCEITIINQMIEEKWRNAPDLE